MADSRLRRRIVTTESTSSETGRTDMEITEDAAKVRDMLEQIIRKLRARHRGVRYLQTTGNMAAVAGGVAALLGATLLAPATCGTSLLAIGGSVAATVGGVAAGAACWWLLSKTSETLLDIEQALAKLLGRTGNYREQEPEERGADVDLSLLSQDIIDLYRKADELDRKLGSESTENLKRLLEQLSEIVKGNF